MTKVWIGIDISKASFMVARRVGKGIIWHQYANELAGFEALVASLAEMRADFVLEYTGNYHLKLVYYLIGLGYSLSLIDPKESANYAKMRKSVSKTDKQDALRLLEYGEQFQPKAYELPSETQQILKQQRSVLRALKKQKRALLNQMHALSYLPKLDATAQTALEKVGEVLATQIAIIEKELCQMTEEAFGEIKANLMTVKGIGEKIASSLLIATNGFQGFQNAQQVAKFLGICPTTYQSGTSVCGKGSIGRSGDPELRHLMYMGTWSALRGNQACKELYDKLRAKGKPAKVALIAVANKMIRQIFAVIKSGIPFDNDFEAKKQNNTKKINQNT
jgi:transposase